MQDRLFHRGPDGAGRHDTDDARVTLAMRRLSIIAPTNGGQPLYNETGDLTLVANGEIYNHVELKEALLSRGHRFATGSDCEVILHLYEEKGLDLLHDLRGMFAFALYDRVRNRVVLARDRMGEKPLYLYQKDGALLFASEMKSLLRSGQVPLELDPVQVYNYFHYSYVVDPATPVRGVRKLPAGSVLVADIDTWTLDERCWWRMDDAPPLEGNPVALIGEVLDEVGRIIIRSDVDVGVALSGGLDSSVVAALAAKHYPGKLHAFTIGYNGRPPCDERQDAKTLADQLGLEFHDIELDEAGMVEGFAALSSMRDDPIADIAGWGYSQVMTAARAVDVPVMLQGQGGDELFWGYGWVRDAAVENELRKTLSHGGRKVGGSLSAPKGSGPRALASWVRDGFGLRSSRARGRRLRDADPRYPAFLEEIPLFRDGANMAYTQDFADLIAQAGEAADPRKAWRSDPPWGDTGVMTTRFICDTYLRENGIAQADRLSMAASVELRLPLLDYRLVETVIGLRKHQSDIHLPPKAWFRDVAREFLPEAIINRPKRGFSPPTMAWHRALFDAYGQKLVGGRCVAHGIFTSEGAADLAHGALKPNSIIPPSFKALVFEFWLRSMEQEIAAARTAATEVGAL